VFLCVVEELQSVKGEWNLATMSWNIKRMFATPRGLRQEQVLEWTQNRWLPAHESLLMTGPSGSGKTRRVMNHLVHSQPGISCELLFPCPCSLYDGI
jgi:hypothetical protein